MTSATPGSATDAASRAVRLVTSEQLFLTGCLGIYGETDPVKIQNVIEAFPWRRPGWKPTDAPMTSAEQDAVITRAMKTSHFEPRRRGPLQYGRRFSAPRPARGTQPRTFDPATRPHTKAPDGDITTRQTSPASRPADGGTPCVEPTTP